MGNRNCVQIGLGHTAEFYYLTAPNWREVMENPGLYPDFNWEHLTKNSDPNWSRHMHLKKLPSELLNSEDNRPWTYFGIDCVSEFIDYFKIHYPSNANSKFMCYQVSSVFPIFKNKQSITLSQLFRKCHIEEVDVLAIDIERHEYNVIQEYNWRVKPWYITIEAHDAYFWEVGDTKDDINIDNAYPHTLQMIDSILSQNYEMVNCDFSNWMPLQSMTRELELQFLRK